MIAIHRNWSAQIRARVREPLDAAMRQGRGDNGGGDGSSESTIATARAAKLLSPLKMQCASRENHR